MKDLDIEKFQKVAKDAEEKLGDEIDYASLTAPCGIPCFACYLYLAGVSEDLQQMVAQVLQVSQEKAVCRGCRAEEGQCAHLPVNCRLFPCAREKKVELCNQCSDFPCEILHPYADRSELFHNTKVYHLCLINKMGLDSWARLKAKSVRDTYLFGTWCL